jgi:hypothetical protein
MIAAYVLLLSISAFCLAASSLTLSTPGGALIGLYFSYTC